MKPDFRVTLTTGTGQAITMNKHGFRELFSLLTTWLTHPNTITLTISRL